ncbi:MAG: DUF881 domain-containing protein [Clostridiales bacterium]|nr:DUF881 domain-containing protein [Clostridiales bacterium]
MKKNDNIFIAVICGLLGLVLSWQLRSTYRNSTIEKNTTTRIEYLKDELISAKSLNDSLRSRNEQLVNQIREYEKSRGDQSAYERNLKNELERARMLAGLVDVEGKGIIINLKNTYYNVVEQSDILKLLNELKASDAQALSVNEERILATSEVREAGGYIIINGKQFLAPFEIKAIAPQDKVENALSMVGGIIEQLRDLYKLDVEIQRADKVIIPKARDDGSAFNVDLMKVLE